MTISQEVVKAIKEYFKQKYGADVFVFGLGPHPRCEMYDVIEKHTHKSCTVQTVYKFGAVKIQEFESWC